ncbi:hypothetical protein Lalb_Chr16g0387501 [Lupinus albus]|uniref:RNase H type-1 domain-containing protein n=1 Tax=Lupinus albus TaxID=3870 RepID=A0A6A4P7F4_LUPAL|nr:hypothetical protein Lalb_Chr16g0387501 [Lupinus albus]
MAACGGVVCDHHGAFIFAFSKKVCICTAVQAELWGTGLCLVFQRSFQKVCLKTDSVCSVQLIESGCCIQTHPCASLVFLFGLSFLTFSNPYYSGSMGKHVLSINVPFRLFDIAPSFSSVKLLLDNASTIYSRGL